MKQKQKSKKSSTLIKRLLPVAGGIAAALVVVALFYHQYLYAQALVWLQPGRTGQSTPLELQSTAVSPEPRIIIPQINVDAPVVYDINSTDDPSVQKALERGVLHFAGSAEPGERGNAIFVGHSSNDVWAAGDYKFIFVLLEQLSVGDTYSLHYQGVRYTYRVAAKNVVSPYDLSLLASNDSATSTLITCTPVGTNISRLIITGEQISPQKIRERSSPAPILSGASLPSN